MGRILVTGGAGYIGSVVTEQLIQAGHQVIVLDHLEQGHAEAISSEATQLYGDICDPMTHMRLGELFLSGVDLVIHMAAKTVVVESMKDPQSYFQTNVIGSVNLLNTMLRYGVKNIIFSSSAAVYGNPLTVPVEENHSLLPINVYGETKLMFEQVLNRYSKAYGMKFVVFRYFNAAGATKTVGENHNPETHLIPRILSAALNREKVQVYGTDYPTKDGSCVRDYVHVSDIAQAHLIAMENLNNRVYNIGTGVGFSILELIKATEKVTGRKIETRIAPARDGDPASLVSSIKRARTELGWEPKYSDITTILNDTYQWSLTHPFGYKKRE